MITKKICSFFLLVGLLASCQVSPSNKQPTPSQTLDISASPEKVPTQTPTPLVAIPDDLLLLKTQLSIVFSTIEQSERIWVWNENNLKVLFESERPNLITGYYPSPDGEMILVHVTNENGCFDTWLISTGNNSAQLLFSAAEMKEIIPQCEEYTQYFYYGMGWQIYWLTDNRHYLLYFNVSGDFFYVGVENKQIERIFSTGLTGESIISPDRNKVGIIGIDFAAIFSLDGYQLAITHFDPRYGTEDHYFGSIGRYWDSKSENLLLVIPPLDKTSNIDIISLPIDNTPAIMIAQLPNRAVRIRISPDARWVYYKDEESHLLRLDGTLDQTLDLRDVEAALWSPDSTHIAFGDLNKLEIKMVTIDGDNLIIGSLSDVPGCIPVRWIDNDHLLVEIRNASFDYGYHLVKLEGESIELFTVEETSINNPITLKE